MKVLTNRNLMLSQTRPLTVGTTVLTRARTPQATHPMGLLLRSLYKMLPVILTADYINKAVFCNSVEAEPSLACRRLSGCRGANGFGIPRICHDRAARAAPRRSNDRDARASAPSPVRSTSQ
jgi:hypothetical protein